MIFVCCFLLWLAIGALVVQWKMRGEFTVNLSGPMDFVVLLVAILIWPLWLVVR